MNSQIPKEFYKRSTLFSLLAVTSVWILILTTWAICIRFSDPRLLLAGVFVIGTLQYHLNILGHDGLHFSLSPSRRTNEFICRWLLHGPQGAPLGTMRKNHMNHHQKIGMLEDHDRQYYEIERFKTRNQFAFWLFFSLLGGMTFPIIVKLLRMFDSNKTQSQKKAEPVLADLFSVIFSQTLIFGALFYLGGFVFSFSVFLYLVLWIVPMLTVMMGLNTIRSCLEHADFPRKSNKFRSYSFTPNFIEAFFLSPYYMSHHAEHHAYIGVPWFRLPALRKYLQHTKCSDIQFYPSYWFRFKEVYMNFYAD